MYKYVLDQLPCKSSFRFVDNILFLDMNGVKGEYTLKKDAFFYEDHFAGNPVTPGSIITEIMVQTGLVVLGIFLLQNTPGEINERSDDKLFPLLTSTEVSFYKMVLPGQKVTVISKKKYFRFGKLKCIVEMVDEKDELIAKGVFAGIITKANINDKLL